MQVQQISDRLQLHKALSHDEWSWAVDPKRVLVLFFPWLGAKEKYIDKYIETYTRLGLDVLTVKSLNTDFLWPPNSMKLAKHTLKALDGRFKEYEHYILHSMSIGSYNLTVLTMLARRIKAKSLDKFHGIIFDSIIVGSGKGGVIRTVDNNEGQVCKYDAEPVQAIDRMIKGMAQTITGNSYIQLFISLLAKMYFAATKKQTLDFYEKALDVARDDPVNVPTLVLSSKDDPMTDVIVLQKLIEIWKTSSRLPVTLNLWENSHHARHLFFHREEYLTLQKRFLSQIFPDTSGSSSQVKKSKL